MAKDKFINVRVSSDFALDLDQLHQEYQHREMVTISFSAFIEMLVKRGATQYRSRVENEAYAISDPA